MRKFIIFFIVLFMFSLVGCSTNNREIPEAEPIITETVSTETPTDTGPEFPMKGIVLVHKLNVRMEPDINHYVSYQLDIDSEIEIYEIKTIPTEDFGDLTWGRLLDGMWVNLRYIDLEDENFDYTVQVDYSLEDLRGLAIVNYMEAGEDGCCNLCRKRICDVVLNRVADTREGYYGNENTVEEVLTSPTQFSYLWLYYDFVPEKVASIYEQHAIERAFMIAEQILLGNHTDIYLNDYYMYMGINRTKEYIACYDCGIYFSRGNLYG